MEVNHSVIFYCKILKSDVFQCRSLFFLLNLKVIKRTITTSLETKKKSTDICLLI